VMNDTERVKEFLKNQTHMVVAVVLNDSTPWAVPVKIKRWEGGEFEWDSKLNTIHSLALESNPHASVTIFEKQADNQFGFYAKGIVTVVETRDDGYGRYLFVAKQSWVNDQSFVKREVSLG